jgi:hypothetical protein
VNRQSIEDTSLTQENWVDLLDITTRYGCENIRNRAIRELELFQIDPVKKIVLSENYDVVKWLKDAYVQLCTRSEPLEVAEAELLGIVTTVKLGEAREKYREGLENVAPEPVVDYSPLGSPEPERSKPSNIAAERIVREVFGV